jgi:hypothetical protein
MCPVVQIYDLSQDHLGKGTRCAFPLHPFGGGAPMSLFLSEASSKGYRTPLHH